MNAGGKGSSCPSRFTSPNKVLAPSPVERTQALALSEEAARRLDVPFLVVDAAQRADGSWVIIETNDAQESGCCGVSPVDLWRAIIDAERGAPCGIGG